MHGLWRWPRGSLCASCQQRHALMPFTVLHTNPSLSDMFLNSERMQVDGSSDGG